MKRCSVTIVVIDVSRGTGILMLRDCPTMEIRNSTEGRHRSGHMSGLAFKRDRIRDYFGQSCSQKRSHKKLESLQLSLHDNEGEICFWVYRIGTFLDELYLHGVVNK